MREQLFGSAATWTSSTNLKLIRLYAKHGYSQTEQYLYEPTGTLMVTLKTIRMTKSRPLFVRMTGWLTVLGGVLWVIKAVSISLTGYQPPMIFEVAPMLMALGLVGLYLRLGEKVSGWGKAGVALAGLAFFTRLGTTIYEATPGAIIPTGESFEFPYSLFVLMSAAGVFTGLILLGVDVWRARLFPSPAHRIPLVAGWLAMPMTFTGLIHIETPIALMGLLWIWVGYIMLGVAVRPTS